MLLRHLSPKVNRQSQDFSPWGSAKSNCRKEDVLYSEKWLPALCSSKSGAANIEGCCKITREVAAIRTKFGVMGSAGGELHQEVLEKAYKLGEEIAKQDCILLTGACPGLPHQAVLGAKAHGGLVVGVSPALCLDEHIERYNSPYQEYDVIIFTGSGLMGREIENIRSCDIVSIIGGRSGTLGEFCIAFDEGKLIAVLLETGGIAEYLERIVSFIDKQTHAEVIYDSDPISLVQRALAAHERRVAAGVAYLGPRNTV